MHTCDSLKAEPNCLFRDTSGVRKGAGYAPERTIRRYIECTIEPPGHLYGPGMSWSRSVVDVGPHVSCWKANLLHKLASDMCVKIARVQQSRHACRIVYVALSCWLLCRARLSVMWIGRQQQARGHVLAGSGSQRCLRQR